VIHYELQWLVLLCFKDVGDLFASLVEVADQDLKRSLNPQRDSFSSELVQANKVRSLASYSAPLSSQHLQRIDVSLFQRKRGADSVQGLRFEIGGHEWPDPLLEAIGSRTWLFDLLLLEVHPYARRGCFR